MFKKINLLQQLCLLILGLIICYVVVVIPLINRNVDNLISQQMFDAIENSKDDYIRNSYNNFDKGKDKQVYHIIRTNIDNTIQWQAIKPLDLTLTRELVYSVFDKAVTEMNGENEYFVYEYNNQKIYFIVTLNSATNSHLISFAYSDYSTELLTSLRNEVVNVQYGVMLFMAVLMMIWVYSLIKPLHKIENYINDIKKGISTKLVVNRQDEIGKVSNALIEMKDTLDKQEKLKEELMHNISHDLKTPIAVIKSYSQSMKDDIYPYGTKEASIDVILENTERLERKVQSFLYLNRLDYINQDELVLDEINMYDLITRIKTQVDLNDDIKIIVEDETIFMGSEEHWRNVIENILENAKRYYKEKITITLDNHAISIFNDGNQIEESVIDNIFKPYFKGEKGNFGIGLSIVKKVVDIYGYNILVENVDDGVRFKIYK